MEDQILYVDSMEEVSSDENPFKKLLKKEQRLIARLHGEQEAEVSAQERLQQAQTRLQRRRKRLGRIQGKLVHVRAQLAELQITDQQPVYSENELIIVPIPDSSTSVDSEEVTLIQTEQDKVVAHESDDLSLVYAEAAVPDTSVPDQEDTPIHIDVSDVPTIDGDEEKENDQEHPVPQQEPTSPTTFTYEPIETIVESETSSSNAEADFSNTGESEHEAAQEFEASSPSPIEFSILSPQEQEPVATLDSTATESEVEFIDSNDIPSETNIERKPTKPLQLEQPGLPAAESLTPDIQSAKEAWIAAESAMQNARNAAHGLAASISFLSQTDGLSNEFMEELVRKQADANKELLKAQDAARTAYERFVQAQRDTEPAAIRPVDVSINPAEDHSQQKQENVSLPPAEENGVDQTAKLHAIRLYKEW